MKMNVFRRLWTVSTYKESAPYRHKICIVIRWRCYRNARPAFPECTVAASWIRMIHRSIVPAKLLGTAHPPLFFLPLIPDRRVNEIDAVGAGQVNYARFPPKFSSRSANGRPLAMGIVRRERARRSRPRRTCSLFFLSSEDSYCTRTARGYFTIVTNADNIFHPASI